MAFKRREEPSIEAEREALREQRAALDDLKRQLSERVEAVRERERELQHAIAQTGSADRPAPPPLPAPARDDALAAEWGALDERARALAEGERDLDARTATLARREQELERREDELAAAVASATVSSRSPAPAGGSTDDALAERERRVVALEADLVRREQDIDDRLLRLEAREHELAEQLERAASAASSPPASTGDETPDRLAQIEERLVELREAERLFLRTREELAARSEALAARERLVSLKERELDEREDAASPWGVEISEVEARLRRLEQQQGTPAAQTVGFSGGLRRLQQGSRKPQPPS